MENTGNLVKEGHYPFNNINGSYFQVSCVIAFLLIAGLLFLLPVRALAQVPVNSSRIVTKLNDQWEFTRAKVDAAANRNSVTWQAVKLPHTWNADDVMDDEPGYFRGVCWYRKTLRLPGELQAHQLALHFEGVNQVAEVYVNGKKAGSHTGGYTAFTVPIGAFLQFDKPDNEILVRVDNSHNESIPPLSADFTFYGGIYRDVFLVATSPVHFSPVDGSTGIYITTPEVTAQKATVKVQGQLINSGRSPRRVRVSTVLKDRQGHTVVRADQRLTLQAGGAHKFDLGTLVVDDPHLWSPEDPYLYTAHTRIVDAGSGSTLDELTTTVGFRWFRFDAEAGFFLNDRPYKLIGASRHQDYPSMGNAAPDSLAVRDVELLKEMGGNFLRVAHYPQDPSVLEACDRLGILASVEIPIVNEITESDSFYRNAEIMQREMIRQNFNHPSVVLWCYMNEVLLRPHFTSDKQRQQTYFSNVAALARRLEALTRKEDPSRYTMMAYHGDFDRYNKAGLVDIPMIAGWNLYSGWYGGELSGFPAFLDAFHRNLPHKPLIVAEYGSDADPRIHSLQPVRFDKSVEYTTRFHQYYLEEIRKRPFVAGGFIWNLADFNSETRSETMPHINNKGLLGWNRSPKDPYYFYQASLLHTPMVKILGTGYSRTGLCGPDGITCSQPLQVASNADSVQLEINGEVQPLKGVRNGLCSWDVSFRNGTNAIVARVKTGSGLLSDTAYIVFRVQPSSLDNQHLPLRQINILLGATRYFIDNSDKIWQPDQPYRPGSWGSVGGKPFRIAGNNRLPYGTDKNIRGTDNDPVYQTQLVGIRQYRLDAPAGNYDLYLHFSELLGGRVEDLAYNLSNSGRQEDTVKRAFNVWVNKRLVLKDFNIAASFGPATAVTKKVEIVVTGKEGITVDFEPLQGEPVLNALEVIKREE